MAEKIHTVLDGFALLKGWAVTVGLWLAGSLGLSVWTDAAEVRDPDVYYIDNVDLWPLFAGGSLIVAVGAGLPLALVLARLLRPVRRQWLHVAAFFTVPTLLLAFPYYFLPDGGVLPALGVGSLLGTCAAAGRAAVVRNAVIRGAVPTAMETRYGRNR